VTAAERQLEGFLERFTPEIASDARIALAKLRAAVPGAIELIYDNYNALVVGFAPTERASKAIFSIAVYPRKINLFFLQGAELPDPDGILTGDGKVVRHVSLDDRTTIDRPAVRRAIALALDMASVPIDPKQPRRLVVRSISPTQRPRRPKTK